MREQDLRARPRRRFIVTRDSDHDGPIFPNLAEDLAPTGRDQLWVADLTYVPILSGFAYLAVVLDAWSRRVVGWVLGRRIDAKPAIVCGATCRTGCPVWSSPRTGWQSASPS